MSTRIVMQLATTSNTGVGYSRSGSPMSTHVPHLRVMPTPCLSAPREGAVIGTPYTQPPVTLMTAATDSLSNSSMGAACIFDVMAHSSVSMKKRSMPQRANRAL